MADYGLHGTVALVAAGSQGIGLATAIALANEGCAVSICGRTSEKLEKASALFPSGTKLHRFSADVSNAESLSCWIQSAVKDLGSPGILITNTGGPHPGNVLSITDEQWLSGFQSTLLNIVRMVRDVAPFMKEQKFGRIVHITSLVAREPSSMLAISSTLRSGINAMTKLQAVELASNGITVNAVLPGHTMTGRQQELLELEAQRSNTTVEDILAKKSKLIPMGRVGTPTEIADVIAFLCSKQASYLTGENLVVDGGLTKAV